MATPTSKSKPSLNITDLFQQEEELRKQLEAIRQQKLEFIRKQADEIKDQVLVKLTEVAKMLSPLMEDDNFSWRHDGTFDGVLAELELTPKEPKPVVLNTELAELVVGFLKTKPHGAGIDDISEGIKDSAGQPRWKIPSLRLQLPVLVRDGKIKVRPDPSNGRRNLYFVE